MAELAQLVFQRPVVIGLALAGAVIATLGSFLGRRHGKGHRGAALLIKLGYGITFASVLIFIVAGFMSE